MQKELEGAKEERLSVKNFWKLIRNYIGWYRLPQVGCIKLLDIPHAVTEDPLALLTQSKNYDKCKLYLLSFHLTLKYYQIIPGGNLVDLLCVQTPEYYAEN